jgi:hypothetical protein
MEGYTQGISFFENTLLRFLRRGQKLAVNLEYKAVQNLMLKKNCLTEAGAYPQLPTQPNFFLIIFKLIQYCGHSELSREEKSKFEFEEKKFSLLLKREVCRRFCLENATFSNKLKIFSSISNFDFSS